MAFRLISLILSLSLFCQQAGIAYASGELNLANYLSSMRNAVVQPDVFQPPRLRYISYDINNNDFKLLLDKGNIVGNGLEPFPTQQEEAKLFNYFLIGLALPNDTFWVNLRPDAPENIIDPLLEKTDIGKIFLEADLQLKKDTASLTSPQNPEGKLYWDKLYKKAGELFGSENITIPTITRPWIVPNEVIVRETEDSAYIYKATLKVMLEVDYLIGRGGSRTAPTPDQYAFSDPRLKELNEYSSQIIRETIIPRLTREVNSSKRYAQLRQVYYSLVLSRWFKQKYSSLGSARASEHQSIGASANSYLSLIDSGNLDNLASQEPCDKQTYFQAYQKSFKDGEYNLKETVASPSGQSIRSYISGGINVTVDASSSLVGFESNNPAVTESLFGGGMLTVVGSPLIEWEKKDVRQDLRGIYNNYSGVQAAIEIIKLFIGGEEEGEKYIKYLEDTNSILSVFEGVKDLDKSLQMAFEIFKEANEHKQRNEEGELTQAISVELNKKEFLDEFAKLQEKMNRLKENPYRLPWIKEILGQIDLFLYEFNDVSDPKVTSRLREIKSKIGALTNYIDVNKEWVDNAVKEFLAGLTMQRTGNRRRLLGKAINEIDVIIKEHQKDDDIKSGNISGSPLTVEDIRKVKVKLKEYAKIVSNFYEGLSSVDLTNGAEQESFSEDYKNYSRDFIGAIELKELIDAVSIALKLTRDKKPFGYTLAKWQEILVDLAGIKERIDLALEENMAKVIELFGDKELHKYFPDVEKSRLAYYNQKYGQPGELKNIATAIEAANIAAALYKGNNIDVREKWEMVAAVLGEIDSVSGQWLGNMRKVRGSLFALKLSIEKWSGELSDDTRNKWLSNIRQEMENVLLPGLTNIQEDISKYDPVKSVLAVIDEYVKELEEGKISSQAALNAFIEQRVIVYMLVNIDLYLARYQRYGGIEGLRKEDTDKLNEILKAFRDEMMDVTKVSSALIQGGQESDVFGKTKIDSPGGIDFTDRAMRLNIERVGSFADLKLVLPAVKNAQDIDLDKEFRQIEAIASSGIVPNSRRILELFSACYARGEFAQRLPQVISCLKASSAIQENLAIDSDDDFRMCLLAPEVFSDGR